MASTQTTSSKSNKTSNKKTQQRSPVGAFVWFCLRTPDEKKAVKFYGEVLGWKTEAMPMGPETTTLFANAEESVAHIEKSNGAASFVSYVLVEDVDATAKRVAAAGGKVHGAPVDVPTIGRMVEVEDPDGAHFFLFKSVNTDSGQPRGPGGFLWNELWSRDAQKAVAFLTGVLGYSVQQMPFAGTTYSVLSRGDVNIAGVMPAFDPREPSIFIPYVHVTDVDATHKKALKLGATALGDIQDVEGVGRMAVMIDPQGARFAFMTPSA